MAALATASRTRLTTFVDDPDAQRLRERAESNDRSVAAEMRIALRDYFQNDERPDGNPGASQNTGGGAGHVQV